MHARSDERLVMWSWSKIDVVQLFKFNYQLEFVANSMTIWFDT